MKRLIATALVALVVLPATPVEAAPDPVAVLKKRVTPGRGVSFVDTTSIVDTATEKFVVREGRLQFGRAGQVAASDIGVEFFGRVPERNPELLTPGRAIMIGTTTYTKGLGFEVPAGKTWFVEKRNGTPSGSATIFGQLVNPGEPATLKALLGRAERSGRVYTGSIDMSDLHAVSPWFRLSAGRSVFLAGANIRFTLTLDARLLPKRLVTDFNGGYLFYSHDWDKVTLHTVTTYSAWGKKVSVKAPPASTVSKDLVKG
ncbi:hypothetical protein [Herbidospora yilanensis]|uniref:hypothetical protein n=1 Tax=Herbidospora yilanensis TaxID=354426 RepID=UPI0007821D3B|nr:hypothetical protein [Herbidospora yilanensis]